MMATDEAPFAVDFEAVRPPVRKAVQFFKNTDTGNAERFAAAFGDTVRFCGPTNKWLIWDGTRWGIDGRGEVNALAKKVVRSIYGEAEGCADDDLRRGIVAWARKSESCGARAAMLELAKSEPGIAVVPADLDADPWLLNTLNCTVDLRTGLPRAHRREDMLTRRTAAPFEGGARSELWNRVLLEAMGQDEDTLAFFQRSAGYSCTGHTSEEKLFMTVGPAGSSKSTIIQAIVRALGDYARTADFEAFIVQRNTGGPKNEIARLAGARFVASIEVDRGKKLAQGLVKSLTGGDVVTARFLYCEAFEFAPTFKLWLVCNDAPKVDDDDSGMWRRMLRIPLDHVVPENERDPAVKAELIDASRSGAAILAWLVDGCLQWQAKTLAPPKVVRNATDEYRSEQDPLQTFVSEACFLDAAVSCSRKALREAYEAYEAEAGGRNPMTGKEFTDRVRRLKGVSEKSIHGARYWTGIGLLANAAQHYQGARVHVGASES